MSAELIAIIASAVSIGGLVIARTSSIDGRLRVVETELAYLRGLLQGGGFKPQRTDTDTEGAA